MFPERDEALHVGGACIGLPRIGCRSHRLGPRLVALPLLVEHVNGSEDHERRQEADAVALVHLVCQIENTVERPGKEDEEGRAEPAEQRNVVAANQSHCSGYTYRPSVAAGCRRAAGSRLAPCGDGDTLEPP